MVSSANDKYVHLWTQVWVELSPNNIGTSGQTSTQERVELSAKSGSQSKTHFLESISAKVEVSIEQNDTQVFVN